MHANYHDTTTDAIVDSMVLVFSSCAHTLFDTGASHSFISVLFAGMLGLEYEPLDSTLTVRRPLGRDFELSYWYGSLRIEID